MPTTGSNAQGHAHVEHGVPEEHRADADGHGGAEAVLGLRCDVHRPDADEAVEPEQQEATPTKPQSSAKTANGKSENWSGMKPN